MNEKKSFDNAYETYLTIPIIMSILLVAMTVSLYFIKPIAGIVATVVTVIYIIISVISYISFRASASSRFVEMVMEHGRLQKELLRGFPMPYALLDITGKIVWVNDEFAKLTDSSKRKLMKLNIMQVFDDITPEMLPEDERVINGSILYKEKNFDLEFRSLIIHKDENEAEDEEEVNLNDFYIAMYMFDVTKLNQLTKENQEQKLVAGLIYIDNYDEIFDGVEEVRHSLLIALVDRKINKYMANVDAIVKSLEKDKYMFVMPQKYLPQLKENKFALLNEVKAINIGNDLPLTLSISLGTDYPSFIGNFEAARSAMELALGRGGDQAVLKSADKITYYGGKSQGTEKSTRVKARVKTLAFKELLETKENVLIMAHKNPDMDAFGSAIGVYKMVTSMDKKAHIVINEVSSAISPIYDSFSSSSMYGDMIINNDQAMDIINPDTMLVVVDVNNPVLTECEALLDMTKSVVVFDHHRQTMNVIANATLSYIEPFASSACEMIAEMLQYMDEKIKLRPVEADAMYAGILIDTDNFLTKTGVRTFEAAAYLRRSGADVMRVRKMFRSDLETYRQKADGVRNAEMVLDAFAVSVYEPKECSESPIVITAKIANEMLNIAGVRASFVVAQMGPNVKISARAIDDVNVQIVMEKMGGGGHANIAAAEIPNSKASDVKQQLIELLNEMYKEGDL